MTTWDDFRSVLLRLHSEHPGALRQSPTLQVDDGPPPPFRVSLAAWAVDLAAGLQDRFGGDVELTVGLLRFPDGAPRHDAGRALDRDAAPLLSAAQVAVSVDHPLKVRSGRDLRAELRLRNRRSQSLVVVTNGAVTARVVDDTSGEVTGGFAGAQTAPRVLFRMASGESVTLPMLVGTASSRPRLGFAVPPGRWAIEVPLSFQERGRVRTPLLPLTVVA